MWLVYEYIAFIVRRLDAIHHWFPTSTAIECFVFSSDCLGAPKLFDFASGVEPTFAPGQQN